MSWDHLGTDRVPGDQVDTSSLQLRKGVGTELGEHAFASGGGPGHHIADHPGNDHPPSNTVSVRNRRIIAD
jgi:hypothetical protein